MYRAFKMAAIYAREKNDNNSIPVVGGGIKKYKQILDHTEQKSSQLQQVHAMLGFRDVV